MFCIGEGPPRSFRLGVTPPLRLSIDRGWTSFTFFYSFRSYTKQNSCIKLYSSMRCSKACVGRAGFELTITAHFTSSSASSLLIKERLINKPNKTIVWIYSGMSNNLNRKVYQKRCTRAEVEDTFSSIISAI